MPTTNSVRGSLPLIIVACILRCVKKATETQLIYQVLSLHKYCIYKAAIITLALFNAIFTEHSAANFVTEVISSRKWEERSKDQQNFSV